MLRNEFFTFNQKDMRLEEYFQKVINLGKNCEFGELRESLTVTKLIAGLDQKYSNLKTKLIAEEDDKLTLNYVMKYLLCAEASRQYVQTQQNTDKVEETAVYYGNNTGRKEFNKAYSPKLIKNCKNCGASTHAINKCPAFGQKCYKCDKVNHFSKMCRSSKVNKRQVNVLEEETPQEELQEEGHDFFIGSVSAATCLMGVLGVSQAQQKYD